MAKRLISILYLATGIVFSKTTSTLQEDGLILDQLPYSHAGITVTATSKSTESLTRVISHQCVSAGTTPSLQLANPQLLIAKIFQLTEWVYTFIIANRRAPHSTQGDILSIYTKFLDWYRDLFELTNRDGSRAPFMLFVQLVQRTNTKDFCHVY